MSNEEKVHEDIPRFEPWVGVLGASIVPALATVYMPRFIGPLIAIAVALFVVSLVMVARQKRP